MIPFFQQIETKMIEEGKEKVEMAKRKEAREKRRKQKEAMARKSKKRIYRYAY